MSLRRSAVLLALSLGIGALAGCGSSSNVATPPPGGAFSNSNLDGTYIFSFSGYDVGFGNGSYFAVAGSLTADGSGSFTGGTLDVSDPSLGAALRTSSALTRLPVSGSYTVTADGRGSGTLTFTVNGSQVQFGLDFVLTSGSHGLITRFDNDGSGSGSIDLQSTSVAQSALQGSYAFGLYGVDGSSINALSTAGSFTLDANGKVTSGLEDLNDNGNSAGYQALPLQGTVQVGSPGPAQLTTDAGAFGTLHFDVWAIDSTHLKLIETDAAAFLEGDAYLSTGHTTLPSGQLVFTLNGEDTQQGSFATAGLLSSDGAGHITAGLEDVNDEGSVAEASSVTGSFSASGPRTVLTLDGIYNGSFPNFTLGTGSYTFAAYPFNGGAMMVEIDHGANSTFGISVGNLYVQSATSFSPSQGYGLNLSGSNSNGEVDTIAQFTASGNNLTGLYDANNSGFLVENANLGTGTYSVASNGRGTVSFPNLETNNNSMIGALNLTFYVVDSSTVVFLETDSNQLASGAFELQNAAATDAAAQTRFMAVRPITSAARVLPLHR